MALSTRFLAISLAMAFWLPCLGHEWFGIPEDWDEVEVERAAVCGVLVSDSVCDITGAEVVDPDAWYRAKRVAPRQYVLRERKQRYYFEASGDTLLWTGYENRLMRSLGSGAPVAMPGSPEAAGGDFAHSGLYAQKTEICERGNLRSERRRMALVMGQDTIRDAEGIFTERASVLGDSASAAPVTERSLRIYSGACPHALVELRGLSVGGDSAAGWDCAYVLSAVLDGGLPINEAEQRPAPAAAGGSKLQAAASGDGIVVSFDAPFAGAEAEITLCSLSGIVYRCEQHRAAAPGLQAVSIPTAGLPHGPCLAVVRSSGAETLKALVEIK